jgi:glycosyltransferase involved in cell wall biosynthesis
VPARKMKVVYLNPSGQLGGAELALLDLMASIRRAEPDWSLYLIVGADGPLAARARAIGVGVTVLSFPQALARLGDAGAGGTSGTQVRRLSLLGKLLHAAPQALRYLGKLRRALDELKPELIHTNGFKMHVLGARAAGQTNIPVIWHVRDYVSTRPLMARLIRMHMGNCAMVVTNSRSVADDVRSVCGDKLKVNAVLDAIDLNKFSPTGPRLDLDALAGLTKAESGTIRVGLLATMARWKGQKTFLDAMSRLSADLKVRGYVIGGALYQTEGSQYDLGELRDEAQRLGLAKKVGFTGFVEDAASVMRSLDIVVHASTQPEPFGLVIAEAMASGRALVASQAGGAAEIIDVGTNALGHQPGDAEGLAECIARLASDADLRQRLGNAGREKAKREFDRARLAAELVPIYRDAMQAKL